VGQVLLNLLVNAAQAIPPGCPAAHVITVAARREAGDVIVEVSDTGSGIPKDVVNRIFEPFFTTKPLREGTGLGLSICHAIVTSLGGEISVDSEVGRGTTFRVTLPVASPSKATRPISTHEVSPRRARLLIVDDEPALLSALALLFDEHEVTTFARVRPAIEAIEGGARFDVILCDVMMAEMSGMEFFTALEKLAPEMTARVIFLTGGAFTSAARTFLAGRANPTVEKPFDPQDLLAAVAHLLG
jgi:CheY-like chemotaxis protein